VLGNRALSMIDAKAVQELLNTMMGNARSSRENVVDDLLRILNEARKGHVIPAISKKDLKYGPKKPREGKSNAIEAETQSVFSNAREGNNEIKLFWNG
jgi:hypothetical protein